MASSLIALFIGVVTLVAIARDLWRPRVAFTAFSRIVRAAPFVAFAGLSLFAAGRAPRGRHAFDFDLSLSMTDVARSMTKVPHLRGYAVLLLLAILAFGVHRLLVAFLATTALGIACELAQATVVGHHARLADLAPNLLGCGVSLVLVLGLRTLVSRRRRQHPEGLKRA